MRIARFLLSPTSSLAASPAGIGRIAVAAAPQRSGWMVEGSYECWSGDRASLTLNFTIRPGGTDMDVEGKAGSFAVDSKNSGVTFLGGTLDGEIPAGVLAEYDKPKGLPTLSIRKAGSEIAFCEKAR